MANIKKVFNFRSGIQVDDDNFIVNSNGLVGIGTTVPTQSLDVVGNVKVHNSIETDSLTVNSSLTVDNFSGDRIDIGITSITSGIITSSNSTGIITYYGDGGKLINLPTSQWVDVNPSIYSVTSIYAAGNVGVATTNPGYIFQVGGNPNTELGIGLNSTGNITATGIITAYSFSGFGTDITGINASNISDGTLSNNRLSQTIEVFQINLSGIATAYSFSGFGTDITGINASNISNGTLSNNRLPSTISVESVNASFTGNLTGIASTALSLSGTPNIIVGVVTASTINLSNTLYTTSNIGIGTNLPIGDFQIKNSTAASLLVTSDTQSAVVSIGRSNSLEDSNGVLRFGNTSTFFPYSNETSFDIINYSTGNLNFYLEAGTPGIGTGNFYWHRRNNFAQLMTLTYEGNLGIAITDPVNTLHVVGTSTVTSDAYFGNNVEIGNNLEIIGDLSVNGSITIDNLTANITGNLTGNVDASAANGISTFRNIEVLEKSILGSSVGIGTTNPEEYPLKINTDSFNTFFVNYDGSVGIKTTVIHDGIGLDALNVSGIFNAIGVGTTSLRSFVDFSDSGKNATGPTANKMYMYPPRVTTAERNDLIGMEGGALVYNVTLDRLEYYDASTAGWKYLSGTSV